MPKPISDVPEQTNLRSLFAPKINEEMAARLLTGLNVTPDDDRRNMIGRLQRAINRNHRQRETVEKRGNISSYERLRILNDIEVKATALSGCFPIDRITRSEIAEGLAWFERKSPPSQESEREALEFINSIKANLVKLSKVTESMAKKLGSGETEAVHFRLSFARDSATLQRLNDET